MSDGGKGDRPRPIPDRAEYERRFDAIDWGARDALREVQEAQGGDEPVAEDKATP